MVFKTSYSGYVAAFFDNLPTIKSFDRKLAKKLKNGSGIHLTSKITIPIFESRYFIELSVTQKWKLADIAKEPYSITTHATLRGLHWDSNLNHCLPQQNHRYFGRDLDAVWPGSGPLEERLQDFILAVVKVQEWLSDAIEMNKAAL